jgi:hypothetical protein
MIYVEWIFRDLFWSENLFIGGFCGLLLKLCRFEIGFWVCIGGLVYWDILGDILGNILGNCGIVLVRSSSIYGMRILDRYFLLDFLVLIQ